MKQTQTDETMFTFRGGHLRCGSSLVSLTPKERAVFRALADAGGLPLPREALIEAGWGTENVGPESLQRCISTLRRKLGAHHKGPTVKTHHRLGYQLVIPLSNPARSVLRAPDHAAAVQHYSQAIELVSRRTKAALVIALQRLQHATAADPDFLPASAMAGHIHITMAFHRYSQPRVAAAEAIRVADDLLQQKAGWGDALAIRGFAKAAILGEEAGIDELNRAVRKEPGTWLNRLYRAWVLAGYGRFRDAATDLEEAWRVNPSGLGLVGPMAYVIFCSGNAARALTVLREAGETARLSASALATRSLVASWIGDHSDALAAGREASRALEDSPTMSTSLAYAMARAGKRDEASRLLARLRTSLPHAPAPSLLAPVHLALSRPADARVALAAATDELCIYRHLIAHDPRAGALGQAAP